MPAEAEAPPDLATPLTASAACFGGARHGLELGDARQVRIDQVEIGKIMRQQARVGEAGIFVLRRRARHGHRALGQRCGAVGGQIVGGDHRLAVADQHAQAEIVAFGAFAFLHRAVAHLDRQRHRAHRHRVGGIGAGGAGGLHQPLGALGEGGLIEQGRGGGAHEWVNAVSDGAQMALVGAGSTAAFDNLPGPRQHLVNHGWQRPVNHGARSGARNVRLTPNIKRIPTPFRHDRCSDRAHKPGAGRV